MAKAKAKAGKTTTTDDGTIDVATIDELILRGGTGKQAPAARSELRKLPADQVVPRLVIAFGDQRPRVRGFAYEVSTETPEMRALTPIDKLLAGLSDRDPDVRLSVLTCLNRGFGPKNEAVYAPQADQLKKALTPLLNDSDKRVKSQSTIVWGRLGLGTPPA